MRKSGGRRGNKKKRKALQRHARIRAAERYDIEINRNTRQAIVRSIQGNGPYKIRFIKRTSNRVKVWEVTIEEKPVLVVYDKMRKEIVTFLPNENKDNKEKSPP